MNSGGDKDAFISQFNIMNNIDIPEMSKSKLNLEIFPNPTQNLLTDNFVSPKTVDVELNKLFSRIFSVLFHLPIQYY